MVSVTMPKRRSGNCRRGARRPGFEQSVADDDIVGALAQRHVDDPFTGQGGLGGGGSKMGDQRVDDVAGDLVLRHVLGGHGDVGLGVDRITGLDQRLQRRPGIGGLQQRAVGAAGDALEQQLEIGLDPNRDRPGLDQPAGLGVDEGTAPGAEHDIGVAHQPGDHPGLAGAEIRLAMGGEDLGDAHAGGALDLFVAVDELPPEAGARRRPTVVLPAPIMPTSTIGRPARRASNSLRLASRIVLTRRSSRFIRQG